MFLCFVCLLPCLASALFDAAICVCVCVIVLLCCLIVVVFVLVFVWVDFCFTGCLRFVGSWFCLSLVVFG